MRKPDRVCLLDEFRGLAVLLMIFYHGAYDAVYIFRFTGSGWFTSAPMDFLQRYIAVSFILIAGIMGRYSRSNFRRGVKTFLCGLLVTAVTLLVMPSERILFGILHFLGAAMMLLGLCEPAENTGSGRCTALSGAVPCHRLHRTGLDRAGPPPAGAAPDAL